MQHRLIPNISRSYTWRATICNKRSLPRVWGLKSFLAELHYIILWRHLQIQLKWLILKWKLMLIYVYENRLLPSFIFYITKLKLRGSNPIAIIFMPLNCLLDPLRLPYSIVSNFLKRLKRLYLRHLTHTYFDCPIVCLIAIIPRQFNGCRLLRTIELRLLKR